MSSELRPSRPSPALVVAVAALVVPVIGLAACGGDDSEDETAARQAPDANARSARDLDRFLMRNGEEPGFRQGALPGAMPRSRETITGVKAFVKADRLSPADARRLRSEGFISITFQPIRGPRETAGVTNVALFATAEGAKHHMAHDLRTDVIRAFGVSGLRRFTVPGIPGARGWTASEPHVGNVLWAQGRCVLTLGNQGPGPFVGPLSRGARAIYERTNGDCP